MIHHCIHGLGIPHIIVDALLLVPFVGVAIMWLRVKLTDRNGGSGKT